MWMTILMISGWSVSIILSILLYYLVVNFRKTIKQCIIDQVRMRNRFVLIMGVYEQIASFLDGLKNSKMFTDSMLEHEPTIKSIYEQFDLLADTMWSVFDEENKYSEVDLMRAETLQNEESNEEKENR